MKILFAFCLLASVVLVSTSNFLKVGGNYCNGNCPNSDCQYCVCGINKNTVDVMNWCKGANWDQACCRCIVGVISKGNSNYMRNGSWNGYAVGLLGIEGADGDICGAKNDYDALCNPDIHMNCAFKLYTRNRNSWSYWKEAKSCGCMPSSET